MPRTSVTPSPDELIQIGIELLETPVNAKTPVKMKCIKCGSEYSNTLTSVKQSFKKYNSNNCKTCAIVNNREKHLENGNVVETLNQNSILLLEDYKGVLKHHRMKCELCKTQFDAIPSVKIEMIKKGKNPCVACSKNKHKSSRHESMYDQMEDIKLKLLEPYKTRFDQHRMECLLCSSTFEGIPSVRLRVMQEHGLKGCPTCVEKAKKVSITLPGLDDSDITKQLETAGFRLLQTYIGTKNHHNMECLVCGDTINATPIAKVRNFNEHQLRGCPKCTSAARYADIRIKNLASLKDRGIEVLDSSYDGSHGSCNTKIHVRNVKCGHSFYASSMNLLQAKIECSVCGPIKRTYALTAWSKSNSEQWKETASEWQKYKSEVASLTAKAYRQHHSTINPNNLERGAAGNEGAYQLDHIVPIRFCFEHNIPSYICADYTNLQMLPWEQNVSSSDCVKGSFPSLFYDYIKTEDKMKHYVQQLSDVFSDFKPNVNVHGNIASLQDPETKFSIFIVPIDKSHSNQKIAHNIYINMTKHSIPYIILFEDELNENFDLIVSKIKHRLGQNAALSLHARKCDIRLISDRKAYGRFLKENHIQGRGPANIAYGAYYQDELVAVMLFSHPRSVVGGQSEIQDSWELVRFATTMKYRIPGIATKMLERFKKDNTWNEIYTFVDRRTSTGNTYERMGMVKIKESDPSAYYVIDGERKSITGFTNERIPLIVPDYDKNLSNSQNMLKAGFWKVWDAGHIRYVIVNK